MIIKNDTYEGNWLLGHITQFVLPLLVALKKNPKEQSIIEGKYPRTVHPSPARRKGWPLELRTLLSGVLSIMPNNQGVVTDMWDSLHGRRTEFQGYKRISLSAEEKHIRGAHRTIDYLRDLMKSSKKDVLFLPGRDVWIWAVMAAQRGTPFVYDSTISRMAIRDTKFPRYFTNHHADANYFMFDTGFAGSIPRGISRSCGVDLKYRLLSHGAGFDGGVQLFNMKGARHSALHIEYYPKYMKTCSGYRYDGPNPAPITDDYSVIDDWYDEGAIIPKQWANSPQDVIRTAVLTIFVWYGGMKTKKTRRQPRRRNERNQGQGKAKGTPSVAGIGKWW